MAEDRSGLRVGGARSMWVGPQRIGEEYAANSARLSKSARSRGCRQGRVIVYCRRLGGVAVPGPTAGTAVHQEGCGGVQGNQARRVRRTGECGGAPASCGLLLVRLAPARRFARVVRLRGCV